jgi:hypothetical protein
MDHSKEAAIRARAYQLWEESGRADGSQAQHWRQAEQEMADREASGGGAPVAPAPSETRKGPGLHSDGMSRHPSVLDPGPGRSNRAPG